MHTPANSNEIHLLRLYEAPLKLVWEAWVDPQQVAQWWGPRGFTLTTVRKDVRTGGDWLYTMHGPDGIDYPNHTKFLDVEQYQHLVYDHGGFQDQPPLFRVKVFFTEVAGQTKMDMTMTLPTAEAAAEIRKFIKQAGGDATWDRLAEFLSKSQSGKDLFVINRSFQAPIETVFKMWTDPHLLTQWLSPTGTTMKFFKSDIQVGGGTFYMMSGPGFHLYGKSQYLEIKKPHQLVYTQQFCDESENVSKHPMAPIWPETLHTTVQFSKEGPQQTRVTVTWKPHGAVTHDEVVAFVNERPGMTLGWTGSFDQLEALLKN